jgi:GNAT superfamily N-acetyltransferase
MNQDLLSLARRLERAQGLQNQAFNLAAGGRSLPLGGGFVHWRGEGHPLNQALGLVDPVAPEELREAEALLTRGGHPAVLELSPAADPGLWPLLAERGYQVHLFQQLWVKHLAGSPAPPAAGVREAAPDEGDLFSRLVGAGFSDQDDWRDLEPAFQVSLAVPGAWGFLATVDGELAGGAMLGIVDGVALLSGDAVLPRFRGRGLQKALIAARLAKAAATCDVACASTLPGTPSQRAYEACGFRAAYPKLELAYFPKAAATMRPTSASTASLAAKGALEV